MKTMSQLTPNAQTMNLQTTTELTQLIHQIAEVITQARQHVRQSVNSAMVASYWEIGRLIVEHEQQGQARAAYGQRQLAELSKRLTAQFGKGFTVNNLRYMRQFFQAFPIRHAVRGELVGRITAPCCVSKTPAPVTGICRKPSARTGACARYGNATVGAAAGRSNMSQPLSSDYPKLPRFRVAVPIAWIYNNERISKKEVSHASR